MQRDSRLGKNRDTFRDDYWEMPCWLEMIYATGFFVKYSV